MRKKDEIKIKRRRRRGIKIEKLKRWEEEMKKIR
jgi:hypothetical protein